MNAVVQDIHANDFVVFFCCCCLNNFHFLPFKSLDMVDDHQVEMSV